MPGGAARSGMSLRTQASATSGVDRATTRAAAKSFSETPSRCWPPIVTTRVPISDTRKRVAPPSSATLGPTPRWAWPARSISSRTPALIAASPAAAGGGRRPYECFEQAAAMYRATGDRHGEASALSGLGLALHRLGRIGEAIEHFD